MTGRWQVRSVMWKDNIIHEKHANIDNIYRFYWQASAFSSSILLSVMFSGLFFRNLFRFDFLRSTGWTLSWVEVKHVLQRATVSRRCAKPEWRLSDLYGMVQDDYFAVIFREAFACDNPSKIQKIEHILERRLETVHVIILQPTRRWTDRSHNGRNPTGIRNASLQCITR